MHRVVSHYTPADGNSNIKVYVRARPLDDYDDDPAAPTAYLSDFIQIDAEDDRKIVIRDPDMTQRKYGEVSFQFDRLFWTNATQEEVFNAVCKPQVDHVMNGYNCCSFACQ